MSTIIYNQAVATHARQGIEAEYLLLKDSESFAQGIADKQFRLSYLVGAIGGMLKATDSKAADILSKAAPLLKDAEPKAKAKRRADVKAGKVVERTADEQRVYMTATKRFSRFCASHKLQPVNKARGKPGAKAETESEAKDTTPKAVNAKQADAYIRMQSAVLKAYAEKNRTILPDALRFAIMEFAEAVDTVPVALSDDETK